MIGCSLVFLYFVYARPLIEQQDVGSGPISLTGLYPPERNTQFSYAYTSGVSTLNLPQTGTGIFIASLRLGAPDGRVPVAAHLGTPQLKVALQLQSIRVYHLLLPATQDGDLQLDLHSTTTRLDTDARSLGVLIDWFRLQSIDRLHPPTDVLLTVSFVLFLLWIAIVQLPITYRCKIGLLLLCAMVIGLVYGTHRGKLTIEPLSMIGPGALATTFTLLSHLNLRRMSIMRYYADSWMKARLKRIAWQNIAATFGRVTMIFLIWRVALWAVAAAGLWYSAIVYRYGSLDEAWHRGDIIDGRALWLTGDLVEQAKVRWLVFAGSWLQWDGHRYVAIAHNGYEFGGIHQPNIAFFPLYPLLIRSLLGPTHNNGVIAALIVSHIALLIGLLLLYDLVVKDFTAGVATWTLVFLLVFPAAVFLGSIFTESLALMFAVGTLWAIRREHWWLAGAAGFFLALTRLPGVLMAPVIAIAYLQQQQWRFRMLLRPSFFAVFLPPFGLMLFMLYQWHRFGTPFAFWIAQRDWSNRLSPPWTLPGAMLHAIPTSPNPPLDVFQLMSWIGFLILMLLAIRRLPLSYSLTLILLLLPPYLSSWHMSFSRYVLIGFPGFIMLALLTHQRWVRWILMSAMVPLLVAATVLFVNGFWVG